MSKRLFYLLFSLIILLGGFLRCYKLGEIPIATYWDETAIIVDARSLAETGKDMHGNGWLQAIFPSYGDYKLPVYIWCASLFVKILGPTALAVRSPSALAGIFSIVLAGLIAKQLAPKNSTLLNKQRLQLLGMLAMSLAFWDIMFSRAGFEGHLGQLLLGLSIYLALKAKDHQWWFLPLNGLIAVLALFTYYSTRFVWPVVFLLVLVINLARLKKKDNFNRQQFVSLIFSGLIAVGIFLTGLSIMSNSPYYQASQRFRLSAASVLDQTLVVQTSNQYKQITSNNLLSRLAFHRHWFTVKNLLTNYSQNLSFNFLFLTGDQNLRHGTGQHGLFALSFLPIFFLGLYTLVKKNRLSLMILLVWWLVALLPASVPTDVPHSLRSLNALLPLAIILGFGLESVWQTRFKLKKLLICFWLGWTVFLLADFYHYLLKIYPTTSATFWQSGYQELAVVLVKEMDKNTQLWVNIDDERFYLWLLAPQFFSSATIQAWPKDQNFQLKNIKNLTWENFVYQDFNSKKSKFVLAGKREDTLGNLKNYGITYSQIKSILDKNGIERFILVYFN